MPIAIDSSVSVTVQGQGVNIVGPKGAVSYDMPEGVSAEVVDGNMLVTAKNLEDRRVKAFYGLTRANLANIVKGVSVGIEKKLELVGVGYRAQMQGVDLVLSLGFSHPVKFTPKAGITLSVAENTITVSGINKADVGETAAKIRQARPPEPYKGKGIKYKGEHVRRKAGKAAKAGAK